GDGPVAATSRTDIDMTAESCGSAMQDGTHHLQLLEPNRVAMAVDEVFALCAKDVGHLHGGPAHSPFLGRRFGLSPSREIGRASMGLLTDCRCRCERWR